MKAPLNLALMRHWENWATVFLMVLIASFAFNTLAKKLTQKED